MKKAKKENYRIVTESGKQLFNQNYTEAGANRIWEMYDGIYTDDNGNQEYIYVEKISIIADLSAGRGERGPT